MKHRKKHRKAARRVTRNVRRRSNFKPRCKCKGKTKRRAGAYAKHTAAMWSKNRAHFKKIGIGRAAKIIAAAWTKKH